MSKAISTLAVGSLINIYENGAIQLYEVAGFNVHGSGTVTLVRKKVHSLAGFDWDSNFYSGSDLDVAMQAFESNYTLQHRAVMQAANIICMTGPNTSITLSRKVFALSWTETTGNPNVYSGQQIYENSQLSLYTAQASRVKTNAAGTAQTWWTRSMSSYGSVYSIIIKTLGTTDYINIRLSSGIVPAFVLASSTLVSDSVTSDGGYLPLFYGDVTPDKPTIISPISVYVNTDSDIEFRWRHNINTGTAQTRADLQYSYDSGEWVDFAVITGSANTYTLVANTLIAGNYQWRARTYNTDGVAGNWSDAVAFAAIGPPIVSAVSVPIISARPIVEWQSIGQLAYQLQVIQDATVIYDTETVNSTDKQRQVQAFLDDGQYTIKVRCQNKYTLWSNWATLDLAISTTKPSGATLAAESIFNGVRLNFSDVDEDVTTLIVYRGGKPIVQLAADTEQWDDYSCAGSCEYKVRSATPSAFVDSNTVTKTPNIFGRIVASVANLSSIVDLRLRRDQKPVRNYSYQSGAILTKFEGRNRPSADRTDGATLTLSFDATIRTGDEWANLLQMFDTGQTILYRDSLGRKYYGAIDGCSAVEGSRRTDVSITIQTTDYDEVINIA